MPLHLYLVKVKSGIGGQLRLKVSVGMVGTLNKGDSSPDTRCLGTVNSSPRLPKRRWLSFDHRTSVFGSCVHPHRRAASKCLAESVG